MKNKTLTDIILIGGGGHCTSVIDVIETTKQFNILGIIDSDSNKSDVLGYPILGGDELFPKLVLKNVTFLITVGQIKSPLIRKRLDMEVTALGGKWATVISPYAYVSKYATIEEGTIVMNQAVINASARIGRHCILNTMSNIEHGAKIEDFCHISTGAIVNGDTVIGQETFIGSNATISNSIELPKNSIISAGEFIKK